MLESRRQFKRLNPRNIPLPTYLSGEWGKVSTLQWITEEIQNQMDEEGTDANITKDEINISRGCERKVKHEILKKKLLEYIDQTINYLIMNNRIYLHLKMAFHR